MDVWLNWMEVTPEMEGDALLASWQMIVTSNSGLLEGSATMARLRAECFLRR